MKSSAQEEFERLLSLSNEVVTTVEITQWVKLG